MPILSTENDLGRKLTDAITRSFTIQYNKTPVGGRAIFNVERTDRKVEVFNDVSYDRLNSLTGDGENYASSSPTLGDELTLTQANYTNSLQITKQEMQFEKHGIAAALRGGAGLGEAGAKTIEYYTQQLIKNGASSSFTDFDGNTVSCLCADGLSVFSNSHTVNGSSSTYDNLMATAFGQTGIEEGLDLFRNFLNADGVRMNARPTTIFSTNKATLVGLISEYNNSVGHPEDPYNGINTYKGRFNHIVLDYLDANSSRGADTSADDYWGLAIAGDPNLKLRVSQDPTVYPMSLVQLNRNALFQTDVTFSFGVQNPHCILLSQA